MRPLAELWKEAAMAVPEGSSGEWRVVRSVTTEEEAREAKKQAEMWADSRYTEAGPHTALMRGDDFWMADNYDEMQDHLECYEQAASRGGRCLIHGLGLGLITRALLDLEQVEHIDVVELDEDVLRLVALSFQAYRERLTIHHDNCFTKQWPADAHWTVVWHDIWQPMLAANLPEMERLHEQFAGRCDWQESWGRRWILERREPPVAVASYMEG